MGSEILSNSWRLVWAEKRLMLIPLVGGILALIIGYFAIVGGLGTDFVDNFSELNDQETVTEADISRAIDDTFAGFGSSQWILNLVLGLIAFFFQFATLTAVFRAFARQPYAVGAVISETWSRIGRVILFTLLIALLGAANTAITAILVSILPGSLAALLSLALWVAYFVATFFLQPIAVAEDTGPIPAVTRSWELGRSVAPALIGGGILLILLLIVYAIGLTITMGILFLILAAIARALTVLWVVAVVVAFLVYGLSTQVMVAAFQAQLYQHAVSQLDGDSPSTPDDVLDEDAFHKPKA